MTYSPGEDRNIGIPQALFLENVMPMTNGVQSVGFATTISHGPAVDFDRAFYLRDATEKRTLFIPANGKNYLYDSFNNIWRSQPEDVTFGANCTVVNIKSRQFICYAGNSTFFEWDGSALQPILFDGLDATKIMGLVAANTYLIAWTDREIAWSALDEPTSFIPSLATGAGGSAVLALKGNIVCCTPISDGFMIYTSANVIAVSYTGNANFPWVFKEIAGGAGIDDCEKVTNDENGIHQYAFTVTGMMGIDRNQAAPLWPELSEFISGRRYELFNRTTKKIIEIDTNDRLLTKINFIAERFLVISYGDNAFTHALVFDAALKRWGKLLIDHVDCFEWIDQPVNIELGAGIRYKDIKGRYQDQQFFYSAYGHVSFGQPVAYINLLGSYEDQISTYEGYGGLSAPGIFISQGQEPYKSLGFLQKEGTVKIVNFDLPSDDVLGVLFLGKYQLSRNRFTEIYEAWLENADPTMSLYLIPSLDGFNQGEPILCKRDTATSHGRLQKFYAFNSAMNFILLLVGKFQLSSLELVFGTAGYR